MTQTEKIQVLAEFYTENFVEGNPLLDTLYELSDIRKEVYEQNRKYSFQYAAIQANIAVISHVLSM